VVVRCDRVDEAVGADLVRVVHPDRHPGLDVGSHEDEGALQVAFRHLLVLVPEHRHDRRDDRRVHVAQPELP
jgi:hypothetical protein